MTCIYCAKRTSWSVGIHFKGSSWQLKASVFRFFWTQTFGPPWQLARVCELWQSELLYSRFLPAITCCVCLDVFNICVCVCVWVRETSAIVGLLHPDNWEPAGLKITQHSPILSSFGTASSVCFESVRVPLECSGSQTVTSCHMVPHCGAHNCLWTYC